VLGKWIDIVYKETIENSDGVLLGLYDEEKYIIYIKSGMSEEETFKTIIHEIGHALLRISALYEIIGSKAEEAICRILENYSDFFIWDNKSNVIKFSNKQKR